jgi:hypothetical protein
MIELTNEERQPCEVWSRCMGYHRPINYWNVGKQSEHRERKMFRTAKTEAQLRETAWNTIRA